MDSGSYNVADLAKKYADFLSPVIEISVDGKKIGEKFAIQEAEVDLTIENKLVGSASFRLVNIENLTQSVDKYTTLESVPLMKKAEIKLGYEDKLKVVFKGFIFERVLDVWDEPYLSVYCMDNKCFMRFGSEFETYKEIKKYSALVAKVIEKYKFPTEITATEDFKEPVTFSQFGVSDFDYICSVCDRTGYEFFSLDGKIYFRKPMPVKKEIMILEPQYINKIEHKSSMQGMFSELKISAYNQDTKETVNASSNKVTEKIGSGKTVVDIFKDSGFDIVKYANIQMNNRVDRDIKNIADTLLQRQSEELTEITITSPGLPELIPGRFLKIDKMGEDINNTYYIKRVRHVLKKSGFTTETVCRSNTVAK